MVRRVGIPKGTFYLFYESKEQLLFDVIMEFNGEVQTQLLQEISVLPGTPDAETLTEIIVRFYRRLDDSFLPRLMMDRELEFFMRTLPSELSRQHAERDEAAMRLVFAALPGMHTERAPVFSAALRSVFLTLLFKDEIGPELYEDTLRVLIHGVVLQLLAE
jgi:AcrR family transcriptional regulator